MRKKKHPRVRQEGPSDRSFRVNTKTQESKDPLRMSEPKASKSALEKHHRDSAYIQNMHRISKNKMINNHTISHKNLKKQEIILSRMQVVSENMKSLQRA